MFRMTSGLTARKLRQAVMLASALSVLLACAVFVSFDVIHRRRDTLQHARLLSSLTSTRLALAAQGRDANATEKILDELKTHPYVVSAYLLGTDGRVVARYVRKGSHEGLGTLAPRPVGDYRSNRLIFSYRKVPSATGAPDTLCLTFNGVGYMDSWRPLAGIGLLLLGVSLLVGLLLSARIQRAIAEPIFALARTALRVAAEKDYSLRAPVGGHDEIGFLSERFNEMMAQIEGANAALEAARQSLEFRVGERTTELRQEIADRERAQRELEEHSARLGALVRNNPLAIVVLDAKQRIQMCNRAFEQVFGYRSEEITGANLDQLIVPAERVAEAEDFNDRRRRGELVIAETQRQRKGGTLIDVAVTALVLEVGGKKIGTYVLYEDITERKQAEEALRRSEQQYRNLFDQIPDPMFIFDAETYRFLHCNKTVCRVYGYALEELHRMTPLDIHSPEQRDSVRAHLDTSNPELPFNSIHNTRDGRRIDVETHAAGIVYEGRPAWLTIARDVTTRNQARRELEQAKEAAEQANRAKSEFLANMSHEIRTPMNGILGMSALALETDLTDEQREYLTLVKSSADSLLALLNDILDFAKIESGKIEFEEIPFSLRDDLGEKMKSLGHWAFSKGIELAWRVRPDVPDWVLGDPGRLRQVLMNLVGNAIKFTEQGEVVVDISLEAAAADGVQLHFRVVDTGIGIPESQRKRIFEAFTQADSSTTRKFGGTGLGLAIAKYLVERMGGSIWLESGEGRGSTFHFTARLQIPPAGFVPPNATRTDEIENCRILVVDDNHVNRLILMELLRHWRMDAEEAASAPAALTLLRRASTAGHPFQLAIVDAQMPDVDGFTLIEKIKDSRELAATKIILLSSIGRPGKREGAQRAGIAAFLSKPVQQSELLDTILKVTGGTPVTARRQDLASGITTREPAALSGKRVLLAEDNAINSRLAARLIEKHGYGVLPATNGNEVLELLSREPVNMILMDVQMPGLDGLETTRRIREAEQETGRHLPIVFLTAHAMKGDRERCLAAGADDYLAKPIEPAGLTAVLKRYLQPAAAGKAESRPQAIDEPIDSDSLLNRLEGDRELLGEMVRLLESESTALFEQVREALQCADFLALQRSVHTLKGAIANFGTGPAFHTAEELEAAARDGSIPRASCACNTLENELRRLLASLEPFRAGVSQ